MTQLYDLNIPWSPSTPSPPLPSLLSLARTLGYTTIALNTTLSPPLPATPPSPPPLPASSSSHPTLLRRATLPLDDPSAVHALRLPALLSSYDILAVRPTTERAFTAACLNLDHVSLISMDLAAHLPFHFRPRACATAVARGVRFEICYAQALGAPDARARARFVANASALVRATRGRGIVLSSEARGALSLRAPADVVNLLGVWGLPQDRALEGFRGVPRSVVVNEGLKRSGFRGVVSIVETAARPVEQEEDSAMSDAASSKKQGQNQKRKGGGDGTQGMSKREAKRMRLAARTATAAGKQ